MLCKHPETGLEELMIPKPGCSDQYAHCPIKKKKKKRPGKTCAIGNKHEGTSFEKQTQGPLVPLQYYTPTPTVLSTSVAFFFQCASALLFLYCSEDIIHSITF